MGADRRLALVIGLPCCRPDGTVAAWLLVQAVWLGPVVRRGLVIHTPAHQRLELLLMTFIAMNAVLANRGQNLRAHPAHIAPVLGFG